MAEFFFHQVQDLLMSDTAGGGDQDFIRSKPIAKTLGTKMQSDIVKRSISIIMEQIPFQSI